MTEAPRLYPTMRCRDPEAMIHWLVDLAGFAEHAVHRDDHGDIAHAELSLGPSILMLGPHRDDAYGRMVEGSWPAVPGPLCRFRLRGGTRSLGGRRSAEQR